MSTSLIPNTASAPLILGDWGTSACRLHLVEGDKIRDGVSGPGIKFCGDPAAAFAEMTAGWRRVHGEIATLLCGTVGANIGWVDAGYALAPSGLDEVIAKSVVLADHKVTVLPGVRTDANAFGLPDVMRSEEVQAFGWLSENGGDDALLCLPGSHTKWVEVEDGRIENLTTGFVGELFETLRTGSILAPDTSRVEFSSEFARGVGIGADHPSLLSAIFNVRAEAAQNTLQGPEARDRLSGILVGADCAGMLGAWGCPPDAIIGASGIGTAYQFALAQFGHEVEHVDGTDAALQGLRLAAAHLEAS